MGSPAVSIEGTHRLGIGGFLVLAALMAGSIACDTFGGSILGPSSPPYDLRGPTFDDTRQLPGGDLIRLTGVRVEVVDGPKAGLFSISDADGNYRLPNMPGGLVQLRATKEGYEPDTESVTLASIVGPPLILAAPPHTLWGDLFVGLTNITHLPEARIELVGGPNTGKVTFSDPEGRYQFDDLVTSPSFDMRVTKAGYQPQTYTIFDFRRNQQRNVGLTPN